MGLRLSNVLRFSIVELLTLTLCVGLGAAALKIGGVVASVAGFAALLFCMALAVTAFVGRGRGQAFAIGYLVTLAVYGLTLHVSGARELDPYNGVLPTTQAMRPLFDVMAEETYIDLLTGQAVPVTVGTVDGAGQQFTFNSGLQGGGGVPINVTSTYPITSTFSFSGPATALVETPDRTTFMTVGHCLIALALGYAGGKFAVAIYARRTEGEDKPGGASRIEAEAANASDA